MNFEERVAMNWLRLNDVEDDIVTYLRERTGGIERLSINKIAKDMFIAPNTVVRFAKKLGYKGFSELKYSLAFEHGALENEEIQKLEKYLEPEISKHITQTIKLIDKRQIAAVLKRIYEADSVSLYGIGDSQYFCELLAKYLSRVSKNIEMRFHILYDSEYNISRLKPGDVTLFISTSGETAQIVDLASKAHKKGAYIIAITMNTDNTLRRIADTTLVFSSEDKFCNSYNVPDLTGLMLLVRYIANVYWNSYLRDDGLIE